MPSLIVGIAPSGVYSTAIPAPASSNILAQRRIRSGGTLAVNTVNTQSAAIVCARSANCSALAIVADSSSRTMKASAEVSGPPGTWQVAVSAQGAKVTELVDDVVLVFELRARKT